MTKKRRCPECNQWIDIDMVDCDCGWKAAKGVPTVTDHRCIYQHSGLRCSYPGTNSSSTHASTTWYCLGHYQNISDPKRCLEILIDAEKNFIAVMEDRIHWTVKLIPEEYEKVKKEIRELHFKLFSKGKCA